MVVNHQQQQLLYVFAKEVAAAVRVDLTSSTKQLPSLSSNECRTATWKLV